MAATGKRYFGRGSYRFLTAGERESPAIYSSPSDHAAFELDELDIWNNSTPRSASPASEFRRPVQSSRAARKAPPPQRGDRDLVGGGAGSSASSLPVNVPDWSKILKDEYEQNRRSKNDDDVKYEEEEYGGDGRNGNPIIPPHEILARTRIASLSVQEGIGRTLKGRDLSRVRNAIWEKTGFQD